MLKMVTYVTQMVTFLTKEECHHLIKS